MYLQRVPEISLHMSIQGFLVLASATLVQASNGPYVFEHIYMNSQFAVDMALDVRRKFCREGQNNDDVIFRTS